MNDNLKNENHIISVLEKLQQKIQSLESDAFRHRAEVQAIFLCLRDATKCDPKWLLEVFTFYSKELHQKQLEQIEDVSPRWAAIMDNRRPEDLP